MGKKTLESTPNAPTDTLDVLLSDLEMTARASPQWLEGGGSAGADAAIARAWGVCDELHVVVPLAAPTLARRRFVRALVGTLRALHTELGGHPGLEVAARWAAGEATDQEALAASDAADDAAGKDQAQRARIRPFAFS